MSGYNIEDYFFVSDKIELNDKMNEISTNLTIRDRYFSNVVRDIEREKQNLRQEFLSVFESC